ncbi:MAG: hypothetical protein KAI33_04010, partial [Elusimicrobiales bacterium]|nr:hypothetical protein [Elusimicrobiales bacterium]
MPPSDNVDGLRDGVQYTIKTRAYDVAGNTETVSGSVSFIFDVSSPTAGIDIPFDNSRYNSLNTIEGTANDAFNVTYPQIRICDMLQDPDKYWKDGVGWVDDTEAGYPEIWNVAAGSSSASGQFSWNYDSTAVAWLQRDDQLRVDVKAIDAAGNYNMVSSTFSFDQVLPESVILYPPVNDVLYSSMTAISGTSRDWTSSISDVKLKLWYLDGGTSYYWDPVAVSPPHWDNIEKWVSIAGAGGPKTDENPWSYSPPDFKNPGNAMYAWKEGTHDGFNGKKFYIVSKAIDSTTNEEVDYSTRTFIFDNEPPMSRPVVPSTDTAYNSLSTLSGTSIDGITTVDSVVVCILSEDEAGGPKY